MTQRPFLHPSDTANLEAKTLKTEYQRLYVAYVDLDKRHRKLVPMAQEKATVINEKRERLRLQREQRSNGGRRRHAATRRQAEYFVNHYWELRQNPLELRVTADRIRRDLTNWLRDPQPIYGIDTPEEPLNDLAESTARKLYTACQNAWDSCENDKSVFIELVRERRT